MGRLHRARSAVRLALDYATRSSHGLRRRNLGPHRIHHHGGRYRSCAQEMTEHSSAFRGTIEWDGVTAYITDIRIVDGKLRIFANGMGPARQYSGPCNIYGQ